MKNFGHYNLMSPLNVNLLHRARHSQQLFDNNRNNSNSNLLHNNNNESFLHLTKQDLIKIMDQAVIV